MRKREKQKGTVMLRGGEALGEEKPPSLKRGGRGAQQIDSWEWQDSGGRLASIAIKLRLGVRGGLRHGDLGALRTNIPLL